MTDQPTDPHQPGQDRPVPPAPGAQPPAPPQQQPGYQPYAQPGHPQQGYAQQPQQPGYGPQGGFPQQQPGAFSGLFDLGFGRRITPALAKMVYLGVLVLAAMITVLGILAAIGAFSNAGDRFIGGGFWIFYGLILLVGSPLVGFLTLAFSRFWLEYFVDRAAERQQAGR